MSAILILKGCNFIIGRILNFGDEIDFNWAKEFYGLEKNKTLKESRQLDKNPFIFGANILILINPNAQTSY